MSKRSRKSLSLSDKLNILKTVDENPSKKKIEIARQLNIPTSTLHTIIAKRKEIEENASVSGSSCSKKKRVQAGKYEDMELCLIDWFKQQRAAGLPISGPILTQKAKEICAIVNVPDEFLASSGWLHKFKLRFGLRCKTDEESGAVNCGTVRQWKEKILPHLTRDYELKNIFTADETGLFFNLLPDKTLAMKNEQCRGGKKSKERITVLLCANADGSEKLTPLVIGKFGKPRCFKQVRSLPTKYNFNKKAWLTTKVFDAWLRVLDAQMGAQNRKILLFVDQCSAHPPDTSYLRNVTVKFLPATCTSELQPFDLGLIKNMKMKYRHKLLARTISRMNRGMTKDMKINVLQAMNFIASSWNGVTVRTIERCFRKAGFIPRPTAGDDDLERDEEGDVMEDEDINPDDWRRLGAEGTFEDFVNSDNSLITSEIQSIDDLVAEHMEGASESEDDETCTGGNDTGVPKFHEALEMFEGLQTYLMAHNLSPEDNDLITKMNNLLYKVNLQSNVQTKISDYFKSKKLPNRQLKIPLK